MANTYFKNKTCVVTGAGSGMGREMTLQLIELGAKVFASDINNKALIETKTLAKDHANLKIKLLDVSDKNAIYDYANQIIPNLDQELILINNAGVSLNSGKFETTNIEDIEWLFSINFWGCVHLTKAFYPYCLKNNSGHIVNISSIFGLGGFGTQSAYSPAKFALRGFTEVLRMELIGTNIKTTSVHPGGIKTNIARGGRVAHGSLADHEKLSDSFENNVKTTAEKAASIIIKGIRKNKEKVLVGPDAWLVDKIIRIFPTRFTKMIDSWSKKTFNLD